MNHFDMCAPSVRAIFEFSECFHKSNMDSGVSRIIVWTETGSLEQWFLYRDEGGVALSPPMTQRAFSNLASIYTQKKCM